MKNRNWLINLSIIGLLWFSLAFACNNGSDRGRTTSSNVSSPARNARQNTDGELTEQDVRDYFTQYHMKSCNELYECRVIFDTPIEIGAATRRNIEGGLPPPGQGGWALAYPVKVEVSFYKREKSSQKGQWAQNRGGVHFFYRDVNRVWNDAPLGVNLTFDDENR